MAVGLFRFTTFLTILSTYQEFRLFCGTTTTISPYFKGHICYKIFFAKNAINLLSISLQLSSLQVLTETLTTSHLWKMIEEFKLTLQNLNFYDWFRTFCSICPKKYLMNHPIHISFKVIWHLNEIKQLPTYWSYKLFLNNVVSNNPQSATWSIVPTLLKSSPLVANLKCPLNSSRPFSAHTSLNIGSQCNPLAARPFDPVIGFKDTNALHCRGFQLFSTVALVSPD